jgi:hypothetical protein
MVTSLIFEVCILVKKIIIINMDYRKCQSSCQSLG